MSQLSLFAPRFDERVRLVEIDGVTYFSVTDIFMQYGSEGSRKDPRKYWERALKRLVEQGADVVTGVSRHQVASDAWRAGVSAARFAEWCAERGLDTDIVKEIWS